jgi:hypothetical protein
MRCRKVRKLKQMIFAYIDNIFIVYAYKVVN